MKILRKKKLNEGFKILNENCKKAERGREHYTEKLEG